MLCRHIAHEPDDRLVEARRRIDLELDVENLPALAEVGHDILQSRLERTGEGVREIALVAPGERVVETAVALECGRRALESLRSERGSPHAAARGLGFCEVTIARADSLPFYE